MRILCFTDNHFCETSSGTRKLGQKYSLRLENQIKSINWVEQTAVEKNCEAVICLGDFFDKPILTDNELTALKDIKWNTLPHYFLVGNHESEEADLCYSVTKALETENHFIISEPSVIDTPDCRLKFLPYIVERNRQLLKNYFADNDKPSIIFSHNDIKGIQMGPAVTRTGFEVEDIQANCNLFLNGHLHNGGPVAKGIYNLGNLTGQDFKEDANRYKHYVAILDTTTQHVEVIENPEAFNYYTFDVNEEKDLAQIAAIKNTNAIVKVNCLDKYITELNHLLEENPYITDFRILLVKDLSQLDSADLAEEAFSVDYFVELDKFCKEKLENTEVLAFELAELCK